jgi:hypothetical protein
MRSFMLPVPPLSSCDRTLPRAPIVKSLLQHGVDHNTSDLHRDTPIHTLLRKLLQSV